MGTPGAAPDGNMVNLAGIDCPACNRLVGWYTAGGSTLYIFYPPVRAAAVLPESIPQDVRDDYTEACAVLPHSARASAALSRRILQHVLRENGYKAGNLEKEIDKAIPDVSSALGEVLHAVRHVGNFAAHPIKSTNTGEIVDVEPGEAEWLTQILVDVFDELYVKRAAQAARVKAINARLREAGKPELPVLPPDQPAD